MRRRGHAHSAPSGWPAGHWAEACWLELFRVLAGKEPGDFCLVAGVVGLVVAGRGGVAVEVLPAQALGEEDADRGAAAAADREGLLVLGGRGVFGGLLGGGGERDLERLGVDHAQERQRG